MVNVAGIDLGAMIEKICGNLDRASEVQRGLAVAAAGMNALRVRFDQFAKAVHPTQAHRGMDVHNGPASLRRTPPNRDPRYPGSRNHRPTTGSWR